MTNRSCKIMFQELGRWKLGWTPGYVETYARTYTMKLFINMMNPSYT
ncbi:hypothetical protein NT6N_10020 [Oceaniferula spumae]|uniref:Uncharacterized protein n=1 Tax=Oceaniferula spumae TaxID=2979115 RepID=A0AAT9FJ55_9BACT